MITKNNYIVYLRVLILCVERGRKKRIRWGKSTRSFFFLLTVLSIDIYLFIYYSINDRGREKRKENYIYYLAIILKFS